jgi:hypothetical protein
VAYDPGVTAERTSSGRAPVRPAAPPGGASLRDRALYLVGVFGLSASLTALWLGMRTVMNVGGYCASGGPYEIAVPCPEGVEAVLFLSIPAGLVFAGLVGWSGSRIGRGWARLLLLAWPAMFLSLGWNFLEYAVRPPDGSGDLVLGWLVPGIVFVAMGGVPLLFWLGQVRAGTWSGSPSDPRATVGSRVTGSGEPVVWRLGPIEVTAEQPQARTVVWHLETDAQGPSGATGQAAAPGAALADQLERLAGLHASGALSASEYEAAKAAVIASAARGGAGRP